MKKVATVVMAMAFTVSAASVSMASTAKCTVKSVDGTTVVLDCKRSKLKAGDSVTVRTARKTKAIEGC